MSRRIAVCSLFLVSGLLVFVRADAEPARTAPVVKGEEPLAVKLFRPVKFSGFEDPGLKLGDVLAKLGKDYGVEIEVNELAFKAAGVDDVLGTAVNEKPIRKSERIRLDRLLRTVLARLPAQAGATYVLRRDGIELTTVQAARVQIWGSHNGPFLPLVHATFEQKPLAEALRELADQAEYNIVLDNRAGEKGKAEVSARFVNTPLDTAVSFVADMVDLRPVLQDNVIYVTTRENAALMESRLKKDPLNDAETAGPRIGSGVASPVLPAGPGGGM
jgi:hypothetical protein